MLARLAVGIALLWALVVPLLHGHPAGQAAHVHEAAHAPADVAGRSHHGLQALAAGGHEDAGADRTVALVDHQHVDGTAEHDLPVANADVSIVVLLMAVASVVRPTVSAPGRGVSSEVESPTARGSPVARHEVARI